MLRKLTICAFAVAGLAAIAHAANQLSDDDPGEGFDREDPAAIQRAHDIIDRDFAGAVTLDQIPIRTRSLTLMSYQHLDPKREVPSDLLRDALAYFDANKQRFPNQAYITIVDFKKRSDVSRFFLINMETGAVEKYHTTHGIHSDENKDGYAERFGNVPNSGRSSLGFVRTAEVYNGKYKRSVRLDGLSKTNSKIRDRAIVFHGWDKVHEANVIQGLSWGCITLDWAVKDGVLDKIKEGSLMYVGVSK
jgi:hypothetical protein